MDGKETHWLLVTGAIVTFCLFIGWALVPVLSELCGAYRGAASP